jgi:hypothetical protein
LEGPVELSVYLAGGSLVLSIGWVLAVFGEPAPFRHQLTEGVKRSAEVIDAIYGAPFPWK